jgi:peroxiredoxin
MQRETPSSALPFGASLPAFSLPSTTGATIGSDYLAGAKAALVVFSCNHCPYVRGSDEMLLGIIKAFQPQGLKAVIISSNDATQYPEDSFEKMQAKATAAGFPCPYLYDESQSVARAFDAQCTPECYLFDSSGKLAYHGTVNDNPRDKTKASKDFLSTAISQVLSGAPASPNYVHPVGCSIKWKLV